jgi:hypothetical protein
MITGDGVDGPGPQHAHHWRIGGQGGPTSAGICDCGAQKQFQNGWDQEHEVWSARLRRNTRRPISKLRP